MKNKPFRCLDLSSFDKNRNKLVEKEGLSKPQLMQFCMISNIDMHERLWKCIHFCIGTKNSKSVEEEILSKTVGHIVLYNISILKCFKCSLNVFIIVSWQKEQISWGGRPLWSPGWYSFVSGRCWNPPSQSPSDTWGLLVRRAIMMMRILTLI